MPIGTISSNDSGLAARAKINAALQAIDGLPKNVVVEDNPTSASDASQGYSVNSKWFNPVTGIEYICRDATAGAAAWVRQDNADFFGYVSGNYYHGVNGVVSAGAVAGGGTIRLHPIIIKERCTVSELGARVTTSESGKSFQLAIYAADAASKLPTGNPLGVTSSLSSGSTGAMTAAIVGGGVTLNPGIYWVGINGDVATAVFQVYGINTTFLASVIGGTAAQISSGTGSSMPYLTITQAFGTWPDLTGVGFGRGSASSAYAAIFFKVG